MNVWLILVGVVTLGVGWLAWWITLGRYLFKLQRRLIGLFAGAALRAFGLYRPWQAWLGRRLDYDVSGTATADDPLRSAPSRFSTFFGCVGVALTFLGISMILEGLRGRGIFGITIFS